MHLFGGVFRDIVYTEKHFVWLFLSLQEVGKEKEGNSELQTGNDSDGQQLAAHDDGGHAHAHAHAERTQ